MIGDQLPPDLAKLHAADLACQRAVWCETERSDEPMPEDWIADFEDWVDCSLLKADWARHADLLRPHVASLRKCLAAVEVELPEAADLDGYTTYHEKLLADAERVLHMASSGHVTVLDWAFAMAPFGSHLALQLERELLATWRSRQTKAATQPLSGNRKRGRPKSDATITCLVQMQAYELAHANDDAHRGWSAQQWQDALREYFGGATPGLTAIRRCTVFTTLEGERQAARKKYQRSI